MSPLYDGIPLACRGAIGEIPSNTPVGPLRPSKLRRRWVAHVVAAVLSISMMMSAPHAWAQQIWFGPRTPDYGATAAVDWSQMFAASSNWQKLAVQIQVFIGSTTFFLKIPDNELKAMAAALTAHGIALAMPVQAIAARPNEPCGKHEGFGDAWVAPKAIDKLTRLGVKLQILRIDGPVWFGHYDPTSCKLPIAEVAARVAAVLKQYLAAFPDVQIGDVEGPQALEQFADWQTTYATFKHDLESKIGRRLTFLHVDVGWRQPSWPTAITAMARFAHANGMAFGVIYDSDAEAPTDRAWVAGAKAHFDQLETRYGLISEQAVFQTWNQRPTHIFPETDDSAQSWLVAQYLLPRTQLSAHRTATGVAGRLTQTNGQPVAGAPVIVKTLGDDPTQPPPVRVATGTVPPDARFAMLGLRVNQECWCSGDNDLIIGTASYRETAGGNAQYAYTYRAPATKDAVRSLVPSVVGRQQMLRARIAQGGNFGFTSPIFQVTPGAQFEFRIPIATLNGSGMFGTATVIWLDAQRHGLRRTNIVVGDDAATLATTRTDASGGFSVALPATSNWQQRPILLHYAGSPTLRAAYAAP